MSVIAIHIDPNGVTRVFFDCSEVAPDPLDRVRIERAIEQSTALSEADRDAQQSLPLAA
jgi:hypothetical protein